MSNLIPRQHIQDHNSAAGHQEYWGYPSRVVPCANDVGSCEYLDAVYSMHETSMLYTFILWAVIGGILFIWLLVRKFRPSARISVSWDQEAQRTRNQGSLSRFICAISAHTRRYLLPESFVKFFGNTSRIQLLVLAVLSGYLLIFSLIGIVYKTWITPVKNSDKFNTRTGLGGFADRVGAFAYALTPFSVLLSSRESILSLITGIPYHHFNFLHRWLGRIIFIQSFLHTLGWIIIEAKLYQPQPKVWNTFASQDYIIWGWVAMGLITVLYVFSIRCVINWTGYEFFRKVHYVVAALYFGACWAHWAKLACWMIAALILFFLDRGIRLLRTYLIHSNYISHDSGIGFNSIPATLERFTDPDDTSVLRLTFKANHDPWLIGQHFYICFPALSIWQSHPFTPTSTPALNAFDLATHTYIIRAQSGQTAHLATLAASSSTTPVLLTGPYGTPVIDQNASSILAIAGGTGISFALPIALSAATNPSAAPVHLVWIIRHAKNGEWIAPELSMLKEIIAEKGARVRVSIYVTRDSAHTADAESTESTESGSDAEKHRPAVHTSPSLSLSPSASLNALLTPTTNFTLTYLPSHPCIHTLLDDHLTAQSSNGAVQVAASGPVGLGADLRRAVAERNDGGKVWRGQGGDVRLWWDDRLG